MIFAFGSVCSAQDLLEGEVLHMQFNEGSGQTIIDWAEQGNHGTIEGNANWVDGKYNGALSLDGTTHITVPNAGPLTELSKTITVAAWVKPDDLRGWRNIVEMDGPHGWSLGFNGDKLVWSHYHYKDFVGQTAVSLNEWTHVAASWYDDKIDLYINGELDSSHYALASPLNVELYRTDDIGKPDTIDEIENAIKNRRPTKTGYVATVDFQFVKGSDEPFYHRSLYPHVEGNAPLQLQHPMWPGSGWEQYFYMKITGFLHVPETGEYQFHVRSDDGFRLKIDEELVTEHQGTRSPKTSSKVWHLDKGMHPIELVYFQAGSGKGLSLEWTRPGHTQPSIIEGKYLFGHYTDVSDVSDVPSLDIGWKRTSGSKHFIGYIDDLWVFDEVKYRSEIQRIMDKPNAAFVDSVDRNGKINVAVDSRVAFTIDSGTSSPERHYWQKTAGSDIPSTFERGSAAPQRSYTFDQMGEWSVYRKVVDTSGSVSDVIKIPVYAWNRPEVMDTPSQSVIQAGTVSWYDGKYVGIVDKSVKLMADGTKGSDEADENIVEYIWDFDNDWDTIELEQTEGKIAEYTWNAPSLSGKISCKAVTNYGIESEEQRFDLKIYDVVEVNPGGPYTARPNKVVKLEGTINETSYPGYQSIEYQWSIHEGEPPITSSDGYEEYAWAPTGNESDTYQVELTVKVFTAEDLLVTGNASASVTVESGKPTAMPGGPYRGGIVGGNASPIQFEGNHPDFVEADDIGTIVDWQWFFGNPNSDQLGLVGEFYQYPTDTEDLDTGDLDAIESYIQDNNVTPEVVMRFETIDFPTTDGGFQHSNAAYEPIGLQDWFFARFTGFVEIQEPGDYSFHVNTEDGCRLKIDGKTMVSGVGEQSVTHNFEEAGSYPIELAFFEQDGDAGLVLSWTPPEGSEAVIRLDSGGFTRGIWNPTHIYARAGTYPVRLRVQSEFGKWSTAVTTKVQVIDGKITGRVQASDLRTPVKEAILTLTSSHVDKGVLAQIAHLDESLSTTGDGGISVATDEKGYYAFEHIPLGSYRIAAGQVGLVDGDVHEFETAIIATELTLDAPNQPAVDFVDINVFPIGGRIVYSMQKNDKDVLVDDVVVEAQAVSNTNSLKSLPSTKSLDGAGGNYSLPLFSGKYLFLANREGRDISIKKDTPDYASNTGLVTIDRARTDIDFMDYTTRELTVFVEDSGGNPIAYYPNNFSNAGDAITVSVSGTNGQEEGRSDESPDDESLDDDRPKFVFDDYGARFVFKLNPGKDYTITVPGGMPKGEDVEKPAEVDLTGGDMEVTMVIPVKIELHIVSENPKLLDAEQFLEQCGLEPEHNPEGYMYYHPPEPQTHTYIITATANGNPVEDFTLFVTDEISMVTEDRKRNQFREHRGNMRSRLEYQN